MSAPRAFLMAACILPAAAAFFRAAEPGGEAPVVTILFTGEVHAALLPCDCPLQPLGGAARRAALIQRFRARGPAILVDAGGWSAGGVYDEESDGEASRDALRSGLMAAAMGGMSYDAVAFSEGDLAFLLGTGDTGATAARALRAALLAPANAPADPTPWDKLERKPPAFRTISAGGLELELLAVDEAPGLPAPAEALAKSPREGKTGFRLLISRLGEDRSAALAESSQADLILNAGRKSSTRVTWTSGDAVIANFDFQAQRLGVAEVFPRRRWKPGDPRPRWEIRVRHEPVAPELRGEPGLEALLAPHLETLKKKTRRQLPVEFWTMPRCPYSTPARADLERFAAELSGRAEVAPRFLVSKGEDGKFRSLHGEEELRETRIQMLMWRYYPERFWEWLRWRERNPATAWEEGAKALGLLRARLAGALAAGEAEELLERDWRLAQRRGVRGTPTLFFGNRRYDGPVERLRMLSAACALLEEPKPAVCAAVPVCFFDAQCRKRGFIGKCLEAGTPRARCDFSRPAIRVPVQVLVEKDALWRNHESILESLLDYLPGLEWEVLDPSEGKGQESAEQMKPDRYPAYVLAACAKEEAGFEENLSRFAEVRGPRNDLLLKSVYVGARRIAERPRLRGRADLFLSRFSREGQQALEVALEVLAGRDAPELVFHDALFWRETPDAQGRLRKELAALNGLAELQEAALGQAVRQLAPEKHLAYLKERGRRRGSLFWDRALSAAGLDAAAVRPLVEGPDEDGPAPRIRKALEAEADLLASLRAGGEVVLLGENCEVLPARSREELREWLTRLGLRRTGKKGE